MWYGGFLFSISFLLWGLGAVFDYGVLSLLGVERLFVSRIAKFSLVDVYYGGHTDYTCLGRLLCLLYSYAYCLIYLK
jgi:hypothetical protein